MLALLAATALAVTPIAGLEFTPFSRADAAWIDEGRTTGTGVGEFDGTVAPSLAAFGGVWFGDHIGLVGSIGIARLTSTSWAGDTWRSRHWGVVRPALDVRFGFGPRKIRRPVPWLLVGGYGDIPSARDTSNGYTDEEQDQADETAYVERARLGGFGFRTGGGVDFRLIEGLSLGAQITVGWHQSVLQTDENDVVTSWVTTKAALLLTFEWPDATRSPKDGPPTDEAPTDEAPADPPPPADPAPAEADPA